MIQDKRLLTNWLDKHNIKNYTLIRDAQYGFVVDVDGDIDLRHKKLTQLPVQFGHVTGSFCCYDNQLQSLKGAPHTVGVIFSCSNNCLTNLIGAPERIGNSFYCNNNKLVSLEGSPQNIPQDFHCIENLLKSLLFAPKNVGGDFYCDQNRLTNILHMPASIGGYFACYDNPQLELVGLEYEQYGEGIDKLRIMVEQQHLSQQLTKSVPVKIKKI